MQVLEVTKKTTANKDAIWQLWADVPNRTSWDAGLEWAKINGPFQLGATGELKLKDQPARKYKIIECEPNTRYTDRFFLPMGGKMDWHHSIKEMSNGENEVTFRIEVSGPTSFLLLSIMKLILKEEIPKTVEKLITLAEKS
ncbi:hypothetical protein ACE38V_19175 [Cytobacillus sp. Hz8]|uniref:hypothetical protein n=1 Tax=Cytobacillus sp. Hz8 TaxID=3347168 RepID=UPI0035DAC5BD